MSMEELDALLDDLGQGMGESNPEAAKVDFNTLETLVDSNPTPSSPNTATDRLKNRIKERRISRRVQAGSPSANGNSKKPNPGGLDQDLDLSFDTNGSEETADLNEIDSLIATLDMSDPIEATIVTSSPSPSPVKPAGERPSGHAPPPSRPVSEKISPDITAQALSGNNFDFDALSDGNNNYGAPGQYAPDPGVPQVGDYLGNLSETCGICSKPIFGQLMSAGGKCYHPQCFQCHTCGAGLGAGNFYNIRGVPTCESCYASQALARCGHCDRPIQGSCIEALNKKWHVNCFICSQCLKPFGTSMYYEKEGNPFCEGCFYGIFTNRCGGCDQPITGESINACGKQWHPEHFACTHCKKVFGMTPYYEHNGQPYCQLHYHAQQGTICGCGCGRHVMGRMISALGKQFLPEHFVCAFCVNPLSGDKFSERDGKAYCQVCFGKLFRN